MYIKICIVQPQYFIEKKFIAITTPRKFIASLKTKILREIETQNKQNKGNKNRNK